MSVSQDGDLKSFEEIPEPYRYIFSSYPCLNRVQSAVFNDVFNSHESLVITAPTGSGKTVLFELAIIKQIMGAPSINSVKAVYVAPVKALCSERFQDWNKRFGSLGISCIEVTGDSLENVNISDQQIILTTPEKWDSVTRRWRDNRSMIQEVRLLMLDEVHLLSDPRRGPILETVVCRMKTMAKAIKIEPDIRFIAVSATIFNIEDVARWLGNEKTSARYHRFGNEMRPVSLKRIVRGYPLIKGQSPFLFDIHLSYRLKQILMEYSDGKPTLVFCSTRRGVIQTAKVLLEQLSFDFSNEQQVSLNNTAEQVTDTKLRESVRSGVAYHHAGLSTGDRLLIQDLFFQGALPILVATSTLAMGVNLPAHLVILKSTHHYVAGKIEEYSETSILQMVGRAGRPQFDVSATAVIMTSAHMVHRYEKLLDCREILESSLHLHLPEHLNAEIVLYTITDLSVAMDWLRSTFLYQRALRNPCHYGFAHGDVYKIEKDLETIVLRDINALEQQKLVNLSSNGIDVSPTHKGRLMSHYYINLATFRLFSEITPLATMSDLLLQLANADELTEVQLRVGEKRCLNELNKNPRKETIRFPMTGKISTRAMKVNCLVQATLGCLLIPDPGLQQEARRAVIILDRVMNCLKELIASKNQFCTLLSATVLSKCIRANLWENSLFVARQLERIGATLGAALVACGKTSFSILEVTHPRELERILNRAAPFGNFLIDQIRHLPRYNVHITKNGRQLYLCLKLVNRELITEHSTAGPYHAVCLLVGDSSNRVLHQRRVPDSTLLQTDLEITVSLPAILPQRVYVHVISDHWVGLDVSQDITLDPLTDHVVAYNCHVACPMVKQDPPRKKVRTVKPTVDTCSLEESHHWPLSESVSVDTLKHEDVPLFPSNAKFDGISECCFDVEPNWDDIYSSFVTNENISCIKTGEEIINEVEAQSEPVIFNEPKLHVDDEDGLIRQPGILESNQYPEKAIERHSDPAVLTEKFKGSPLDSPGVVSFDDVGCHASTNDETNVEYDEGSGSLFDLRDDSLKTLSPPLQMTSSDLKNYPDVNLIPISQVSDNLLASEISDYGAFDKERTKVALTPKRRRFGTVIMNENKTHSPRYEVLDALKADSVRAVDKPKPALDNKENTRRSLQDFLKIAQAAKLRPILKQQRE